MSELDPQTLRECALLADGERGALIGPRGDFAWMCVPGWACGPAGLLSEEFDVQQRQLRGNLPQAFVHAMLLETATNLAAAL